MRNENNTIGNLSKKSSILRIIGLILILSSFITFIFYTRYQRNEIETQVTLIEKKDSVLTFLNDSKNQIKSKQDSVIDVISSFLSAKKDSFNCTKYFTDPVVNYFGYKNLSLKVVIATKVNFYKKYPRAKPIFSRNDISVNITNDTTLAYIPIKDYIDSLKPDSYYQRTFMIKLNKQGKVFYITAYRKEDANIKD